MHEGDHVELADGEIVPMAAAKANWHSIAEARLLRALVIGMSADACLYPVLRLPGVGMRPDALD